MSSSEDAPNIFTINYTGQNDARDGGTHLEIPSVRDLGRELKSLLARLVPVPAAEVAQQAKQRLRSALDPVAEQHRKAQQHRQQLQLLLNEIDHQLLEVNRRLAHAANGMYNFGASHELDGCPRNTVIFLRDATAFLKEAEPSERLETKLSTLEDTADRFRALPDAALETDERTVAGQEDAEPEEELARQKRAALQSACADLRLDVAVLLESALMAAQQAFAVYKKLFCRLQLLVCEYEPIYRQEIVASSGTSSGYTSEDTSVDKCYEPPGFLPLDLGDGGSGDMNAPAPEVRGALAYSQFAKGGVLHELGGLVLELDRRARRLRECSEELRALLLREAAA